MYCYKYCYNNGGKAVKIMTTTKRVFLFFLQLRPYCRVNTDRAAQGAEFDSLCNPLFTYTPSRRNIQQGFLSSERVFYTLILDFHGQYRTLRSTGYSRSICTYSRYETISPQTDYLLESVSGIPPGTSPVTNRSTLHSKAIEISTLNNKFLIHPCKILFLITNGCQPIFFWVKVKFTNNLAFFFLIF